MPLPNSVTKELTALGLLGPGGNETHSLKRFQRRALTSTRKVGGGALCVAPTFRGSVTGKIDQATVDELAVWVKYKYVAPLGVYRLSSVAGGGTLREDVATAWNNLASRVRSLGGTVDGPYGDTKRPLMKTIKVGASKFSFHYTGRAVDLNQSLADPRGQRYFVCQETVGSRTYWRIYCKTPDQGGKLGTKIAARTTSAYRFGDGATYYIPEGYYIDLSAEIERGGSFERIPAQVGWGPSGGAYNKSEWWHFQWVPDKQATFQDECELIGITEKTLRDIGYLDADLDHAPG